MIFGHCASLSLWSLHSNEETRIIYTYIYNVCVCVCSVCPPLWNVRNQFLEFFQARILEWVAISVSRRSSQSRDQTHVSCISFIGRQFFTTSSAGKESACNAGDLSSIPGSGRSAGEGIGYPLQYSWASLVAQLVKNLPAMWETWVEKIHWGKDWLSTPVFWPGEFHGLYSPWGCKELYMTE